MESLALIAAGFTLLLSAYALLSCWKDDSAAPKHKVAYSVVIMLLPVPFGPYATDRPAGQGIRPAGAAFAVPLNGTRRRRNRPGTGQIGVLSRAAHAAKRRLRLAVPPAGTAAAGVAEW